MVVGVVGGAVISSQAAKSAAQTSANAANNATSAQQQMFNTTEANTAPERALGAGSSSILASMYGMSGVPVAGSTTGATSAGGPSPNYSAFYENPGYQFQLTQGDAGINRQAAATGGLYSTNTLAAQGNYAQGVASQGYQTYLQSLMQMAGLGNASNATSANAATATGAGMANSIMSGGNASAAGILGSANAASNSINSIANNSMVQNAFGGMTSPSYNAAGSAFTQNPAIAGGSYDPTLTAGVGADVVPVG